MKFRQISFFNGRAAVLRGHGPGATAEAGNQSAHARPARPCGGRRSCRPAGARFARARLSRQPRARRADGSAGQGGN